MQRIDIYTDGACLTNPGKGGWGAVLIHPLRRKELSGGFRLTTNNRMELMAAIGALAAVTKPCSVRLYSDSQYVVQSMTRGSALRWRANGWLRSKTDPAINADLWAQLLCLCERPGYDVQFTWVRGHAGVVENERCDQLAGEAALQADLPIDPGYEVEGEQLLAVQRQLARSFMQPVSVRP